MSYQQADFSVLSQGRYGLGFHWTTDTVGHGGEKLPYAEAVARFDVANFIDQAVSLGADHVLFTSVHALQQYPGPHPVIEQLLPGRTCQRDLIGEIAEGLARRGMRFILYYHHGTDGLMDPDWQLACGARKPDQREFYENYNNIVRWMGQRYGKTVTAFWFDAGYALQARGGVPWQQMTEAAKAGHPGRLVAYNSGIENLQMYTIYQDYWAGETTRLNFLPRGLMTPVLMPWYAFVDWHCHREFAGCGQWVLDAPAAKMDWPAPPVEALEAFYRRFQAVGGAVTFNMLCRQDGSIIDEDRQIMRQLKERLQ